METSSDQINTPLIPRCPGDLLNDSRKSFHRQNGENSRLKQKLEDFTKEISKSRGRSNASSKLDISQCDIQSQLISQINDKDQQVQRQMASPIDKDLCIEVSYQDQNREHLKNSISPQQTSKSNLNIQPYQYYSQQVLQHHNSSDYNESDDDDLILTKTTNTVKFMSNVTLKKANSNEQIPSENLYNAEFELKLTDIKQKLYMIKNSMEQQKNEEIDDNSIIDTEQNYLSNNQNEVNKKSTNFLSPQLSEIGELQEIRDIQQNQEEKEDFNQIINEEETDMRKQKFQNTQPQLPTFNSTQNSQKCLQKAQPISNPRYVYLKSLIENSFNQKNQISKIDEPAQIQITCVNEYQINDQYMTFQESKNKSHNQEESLLQIENSQLQQRLEVMILNEKMLEAKISQLLEQHNSERKHYEVQLLRMQDEVSKLNQVMREMIASKGRKSKDDQSKQRIVELEAQVTIMQKEIIKYKQIEFDQNRSKKVDQMANNSMTADRSFEVSKQTNFQPQSQEMNNLIAMMQEQQRQFQNQFAELNNQIAAKDHLITQLTQENETFKLAQVQDQKNKRKVSISTCEKSLTTEKSLQILLPKYGQPLNKENENTSNKVAKAHAQSKQKASRKTVLAVTSQKQQQTREKSKERDGMKIMKSQSIKKMLQY